jgi:hypothetical protein
MDACSQNGAGDHEGAVPGGWLKLFQSAFWQDKRNSLFLNVYFDGFGDLESDEAVADASDSAGDAAASDDFITLGEGFDQGLVLLGSLHLRPNHQEVEDDEHQNDRQELHETTGWVGRCSSLGVGSAD